MDVFTDSLSNCVTLLSSASFSMKLSISFGLAFAFYYKSRVIKIPRIIGKEGTFKRFIQKTIPVVHEPFAPTPVIFGSSLQTISGTLFKASPQINWDESEDIDLPDKGQVHLYWMNGVDNGFTDSSRKPTVLLLPGLTGNNEANYICTYAKELDSMGYRAVVFTYRGMGGKGLKTAKTYCACYTDDMVHVVDHIKEKYPESPLMAVGISLGGMILSHYLIRTGENSKLLAAMTVSVPWNPFESRKTLSTIFNKVVFNKHLTKALINKIESHLHMFNDVVNVEHVKESCTIHEFDESFTRRVFGYESLEHYYSSAQISDKVHHIKTPLLALNASDDPFSPGYSIPCEDISKSDYVVLVLTERGGHVAFVDTLFSRKPTYMDRLFAQYVNAVFTNSDLLTVTDSESSSRLSDTPLLLNETKIY